MTIQEKLVRMGLGNQEETMEKLTRHAALTALFTFCTASCTSKIPSEGGESEPEGDQPCPREGCETDIPCRDDDHCPDDDPCRDYFCEGRGGYCRYTATDEDGDGYVRASCGGGDCDDRPSHGRYTNPGMEERCNGEDDNCDGEVDEDLQDQPCGPATAVEFCRLGSRSCADGAWTECTWKFFPPQEEVCSGGDDDCEWCSMLCDPAHDGCCCSYPDICFSVRDADRATDYGVCMSYDEFTSYDEL
ncbi:putative metal-binding motif-containing protein [Candidatus Uhrbacteria bacterium]|nr:putative metal-binding motif-containing protein [Candidatus Uhrbacteria bacterium]